MASVSDITDQRGDCNCHYECPPPLYSMHGCNFKSVSEMDLKDDKKMEELIRQQPLVCAAFHVPSLKNHHGQGIYMGPTKEEEEVIKELESRGRKTKLHAMLLVGYGEEDGVDYYLVKNCWGTGWGHRGYAKIKRSALVHASYPMV